MSAEEYMDTNCEACRTEPATVRVDDDDPAQPYLMCSACSKRLRQRALRPLEWFNLAAVHGWQKYSLRDDFYDQDGTAYELEGDAQAVAGLPAPSLALIAGSLERLTDYCMTRWQIEAQAYAAFAKFPSNIVLDELDCRIRVRNWHVLTTSLDICAHALGKQAAQWVRAQFKRANEEGVLFSWARAAARCLPHPEGMHMTIWALRECSDAELRDRKRALLWFRSSEVLDWIEEHVPKANVTQDWGMLAALSALDWSRTQEWLKSGRPLSLVAIDALSEFIQRPGQAPVVHDLKPQLSGCHDRSEIRHALERCLVLDDAPRVVRKCSFIIERLDELELA